jgi:hypothetical protein
LYHWQVRGLGTLENARGIDSPLSVGIRNNYASSIMLPPAIRALDGQASEDRIEKAKAAIDDWIKELEAAKP